MATSEWALAGIIAFYGLNGWRLTPSNGDAFDLVVRVSVGDLDEVSDIASVLRRWTRRR